MSIKSRIIWLSIGLVLFTAVTAVATFFPMFYWYSLPSTALNVWIVDKTVPVPDYREHKGLMWALNHYKVISDKTGKSFAYNRDYFGFFPVSKDTYDIRPIPKTKEVPELIYLTDTYGVYTDDYMIRNVKGTRSQKIYGGLQTDELDAIKQNLAQHNTLIGEFNVASSPTNAENRKELETLLGVSWTGWKGRYFRDMKREVEVPTWMVTNYEKQYGRTWDFKGPGFALVSDDDRIVVMEKGKDVGDKDLWFTMTPKASEKFDVKGNISYYYWFEFVKPTYGTEVLANYTLDTTPAGLKKLQSIGLTNRFPAIMHFDNQQYQAYYFAGDYADMQKIGNTWSYYGLDVIRKATVADTKGDTDFFFWKSYVPMMKSILAEIKQEKSGRLAGGQKAPVKTVKSQELVARTEGRGFQVLEGGQWKDFYVKGVNLGAAQPGKWFTEFPREEAIYRGWLDKIGEMNANTLRVYTLLPPEFYRTLEAYNKDHADEPIRLLQEIWPEENPPEQDYLKAAYDEAYRLEIERDIDAIHGEANIPSRKGRASGVYTADVSKYVLGYLVGRELEPEEVLATNAKNAGYKFSGSYLISTPEASPTEAWLAMSCDYVMKYEEKFYGTQHPVAIVSWPTLDPLSHDSEWNTFGDKAKEFNDKASVDINHLAFGPDMRAGLFGAYHVYPNFPDFMNNELGYQQYKDSVGRLMYGGYLKEFIAHHQKYPALVAEFGLATGMGTAHANPDGLNHGGVTEEAQGKGIIRMMETIKHEGYAGGLIFEWLDEWAKKTWTTEPYMIPYERHVYWHNIIDPEQNYGILTYETTKPQISDYSVPGKSMLGRLDLSHNAEFLYLDLSFKQPIDLSKQKILIALDTYGRQLGVQRATPDSSTQLPSGAEFLIEISNSTTARLLAAKNYNPSTNNYASVPDTSGVYENISTLINKERVRKDGSKIPASYEDSSRLNYGKFENNNHNNWYSKGGWLYIRIPWGRLGFSDPSSMMVLNDPRKLGGPLRDEIKVVKSEGVMVYPVLADPATGKLIEALIPEQAYQWKTWGIPEYRERLKQSYRLIKEYFAHLN